MEEFQQEKVYGFHGRKSDGLKLREPRSPACNRPQNIVSVQILGGTIKAHFIHLHVWKKKAERV